MLHLNVARISTSFLPLFVLQVVEISRRQMDALCGNVLELEDGRGHPVLALSSQSYHAFSEVQLQSGRSLQLLYCIIQPHVTSRVFLYHTVLWTALALHFQRLPALLQDQRRQLRRHLAALHHAPIDTIEFIGGGGVRCSLAEVF